MSETKHRGEAERRAYLREVAHELDKSSDDCVVVAEALRQIAKPSVSFLDKLEEYANIAQQEDQVTIAPEAVREVWAELRCTCEAEAQIMPPVVEPTTPALHVGGEVIVDGDLHVIEGLHVHLDHQNWHVCTIRTKEHNGPEGREDL